MQPQSPGTDNPYDFIASSGTPTKKSLFGGGKQGKLFLGVAGLGIITVVLVIAALLFGGGGSSEDLYWKAIQQQSEISRVANLGAKSARNTQARNLAITARQTMSSQQTELYSLAKVAGIEKIEPKKVALGMNSKTDEQLTTANQTNQFDEKFIEIMTSQLKDYQATLKKLYDASSSDKNKATLDKLFSQVQILVKSQTSTSGSSEETPATN